MTTIATDGRTIAADGRVTARTEITTETHTKLHELPDGSVVGGAGLGADIKTAIHELYAAADERREPEASAGDYNLLRLYPSGSVRVYDDTLLGGYFVDPPFAIGSGGEFARGALAAGASVRKAMRIAHTYDNGTGRLNQLIKVARP